MEDHHNTTAAEGGGGEPKIKSLKDDKGQLKWPTKMSIMTSKSKVDAVQTVFVFFFPVDALDESQTSTTVKLSNYNQSSYNCEISHFYMQKTLVVYSVHCFLGRLSSLASMFEKYNKFKMPKLYRKSHNPALHVVDLILSPLCFCFLKTNKQTIFF